MEFSILYLETWVFSEISFHVFLAKLMHIFLYKGQNCPFVLGDIEKTVEDTS